MWSTRNPLPNSRKSVPALITKRASRILSNRRPNRRSFGATVTTATESPELPGPDHPIREVGPDFFDDSGGFTHVSQPFRG